MRLARRAGLESLVTGIVTVPGGAGANAAAKVASIVAGMLTGADSIVDIDAVREVAVLSTLPHAIAEWTRSEISSIGWAVGHSKSRSQRTFSMPATLAGSRYSA